jgi:HlyD family secretion protein
MVITRKHIIWASLGLAAVLGGVVLLRPAPIEVDVGRVTRGVLRVTVDDEGETRLRRRFVVSAPVSGRVLRIEAVAGARVQAGETLATITPASPTPLDDRTRAGAEARVRAAQADLERARSEWRRVVVEADQAAREAERTELLFRTGSAARESAEVARAVPKRHRGGERGRSRHPHGRVCRRCRTRGAHLGGRSVHGRCGRGPIAHRRRRAAPRTGK